MYLSLCLLRYCREGYASLKLQMLAHNLEFIVHPTTTHFPLLCFFFSVCLSVFFSLSVFLDALEVAMRKSKPKCFQRGSLCQDLAGNWTTQRPSDDCKEMQTAVVWSSFPFLRSGQNHLARHSERGKKTRQTEEEVGRQRQGMDRPGVRQVPEGSGEQGKMEKTGCKIICGAPTTLAVKGLMMMMMMRDGYASLRWNMLTQKVKWQNAPGSKKQWQQQSKDFNTHSSSQWGAKQEHVHQQYAQHKSFLHLTAIAENCHCQLC